MNNLFRHIEFLLLRHNCVILPGFGAFLASDVPASVDSESGMILPPARMYMFNQAVSLDDGLLANSYCRKYGFSFDEARQVIIRASEQLKETLRENGSLRFGSIGSFSLGDEGNLSFQPSRTHLERASMLGYQPVNISAAEAEVPEATAPVTSSEEATPEASAHDNTYYHVRISKTFSKVAAAIAIIMSVVLSVFLSPVQNSTHEQRASVVPVGTLVKSATVLHPVQADSIKSAHPERIAVQAD